MVVRIPPLCIYLLEMPFKVPLVPLPVNLTRRCPSSRYIVVLDAIGLPWPLSSVVSTNCLSKAHSLGPRGSFNSNDDTDILHLCFCPIGTTCKSVFGKQCFHIRVIDDKYLAVLPQHVGFSLIEVPLLACVIPRLNFCPQLLVINRRVTVY